MAQLDFDEKMNLNQDSVAYIIVGSAGTGKSSLTNLFAKDLAYVGHGSEAGTTQTHLYYHKNGKDVIIDTVGVEDPNGKSDKEIMIETLQFLQTNHIQNVSIIWMVKPEQRASDAMQKQAKYIDSFCESKIWQSTMIIVKQSLTLKTHSKGAKEASKQYNTLNINIPAITYNCFDWLTAEEKADMAEIFEMGIAVRKKMNLCYECEVKEKIENTLKQLTKPSLQVIFNDSKCKECGIIGDARCMPEFCHFQKIMKHKKTGELDKTRQHSGVLTRRIKDVKFEYYHTGSMKRFHTGSVINSHTYFGPLEWNHKSVYDCCSKWDGSLGCTERWSCCGQSQGSQGCKREKVEISEEVMTCCGLTQESLCIHAKDQWTCCQQDADSQGCIAVCQACYNPWNDVQYPGCAPNKHEIGKI